MGRKLKLIEDKKIKISISISCENHEKLVEEKTNKSELINWLLVHYFNSLK